SQAIANVSLACITAPPCQHRAALGGSDSPGTGEGSAHWLLPVPVVMPRPLRSAVEPGARATPALVPWSPTTSACAALATASENRKVSVTVTHARRISFPPP